MTTTRQMADMAKAAAELALKLRHELIWSLPKVDRDVFFYVAANEAVKLEAVADRVGVGIDGARAILNELEKLDLVGYDNTDDMYCWRQLVAHDAPF